MNRPGKTIICERQRPQPSNSYYQRHWGYGNDSCNRSKDGPLRGQNMLSQHCTCTV